MGERAIINRIRRLQELEQQQEELKQEINSLKEEIKKDMDSKGIEELKAGSFMVRWKQVITNKFDSKAFQQEHKRLYDQYIKQTVTRRFTVA